MIRLKRQEIEQHIKSAMDRITPDVLDRIDLTTPQEIHAERLTDLRRRRARMWGTAAACFLAIAAGSGGYNLYRNSLVDSIVGLDVNPSVELSINRKERVLKAEALNEDARVILDGMDLKGVGLNVAVNAVVGSMVSSGYLEDLDNTILVTVVGDSVSRTSVLRSQVVADVEKTLEENQVEAVVYDQQAVARDDVREMADQYGISYGKAYFLDELVDQDPVLSDRDLARLSAMSMEEIAREVAGETSGVQPSLPAAESGSADETGEETGASGEEMSDAETGGSAEENSPAAEENPRETEDFYREETISETWQEEMEEGGIRLDYAEYDGGEILVYFKTEVRWRNPTVSVRNRDGEYFSARISETGEDYCRITAEGLTEGETYYFTMGGVAAENGGRLSAVSGPFRVPVISGQATAGAEETAGDGTEEGTADESTAEGNIPEESTSEANMAEESTSEANMAEESTSEETRPEESTAEVSGPEESTAEENTAEESTAEGNTASEISPPKPPSSGEERPESADGDGAAPKAGS